MLPIIIGGVALAATGYGIAKFFEDNNCYKYKDLREDSFLDDESDDIHPSAQSDKHDISPEAKEVITIFEKAKYELYRVSLSELQTALGEIKNFDGKFDIDSDVITDRQYNFVTMNDDVKVELTKYTEILTMTQKYINDNLDTLDTIIIGSDDFSTYGDADKEFINNLENIRNFVKIATNSNMTVDGHTMRREVKRAFAKLQTMVE